jgi:hypothetical protein
MIIPDSPELAKWENKDEQALQVKGHERPFCESSQLYCILQACDSILFDFLPALAGTKTNERKMPQNLRVCLSGVRFSPSVPWGCSSLIVETAPCLLFPE